RDWSSDVCSSDLPKKPTNNNILVITSTIFVCRVYFLKLNFLLVISIYTLKPTPPKIIKKLTISIIKGLFINSFKLFGPIISNPALQKEEIEWNILNQIPFKPNIGINLKDSNTAPIPSIINVETMTYLISLTIPDKEKVFICSCIINLSLRVILLPKRSAIRVATVIKPKPPIWIKSIIITWPKVVQCAAVFKVTKPVTQVADVAVKKQSKSGVHMPSLEDIGKCSNKAPIIITNKNPVTKNLGGLSCIESFTLVKIFIFLPQYFL